MTILQQPDALSLSGNIKDFRISTPGKISFVLLQGATEILSQSYDPGQDGLVTISLKDIIHSCLSFQLQESSQVYLQPTLADTFTARFSDEYVVNPDVSGDPVYTDITFRAVRAGIDRFADTATNFLTQNFLTWQPTVKPVTYYSPEFLTYYAVVPCIVKLRAYFTDDSGSVITQKDITLSDFEAGKAYTIPLQYASVAGKLDNELPGYYDVWIENTEGVRLTYIQRYYASDMLSEQEQWILFENSLGGIDTFRAYGSCDFTGEHTHNIAEIEDNSLEYRVDTERKFQKNTGYLNVQERRWLLDFFPSLSKYIFTGSYLRPIVVTESNVTYTDRELPSNYTFTYKYADARPFLNIPRTEPAGDLNITVPGVGSFTVPPRLVEFPRLPLTEGALFPVQDPYSEKWYTATSGSLSDFIAERIAKNYVGGGGIGHQHNNFNLLELLSYSEEYLLVSGKKIKSGIADEAHSFHKDTAKNQISFLKGLSSEKLIEAKEGIRIGDGLIEWDSEYNILRISKSDGSAAGIAASGGVSAKGYSPGSGGGVGGASALYQLVDVIANSTGTGVEGAVDGSILKYDALADKWKAGEAGLNENQLASYLSTNNYAKKSDIPSLAGYATEKWVTDKGYLAATASDKANWNAAYGWGNHALSGYAKQTDLKTVSDKLNSFLSGESISDTIDNWKEFQKVFENFPDSANMVELLRGKVDITTSVKAGTGLNGGGTLSKDITLSLGETGVSVGAYTKLTVDKYGRVTSGTSLIASDIPSLAISKITGLQDALNSKLNSNDFQSKFDAAIAAWFVRDTDNKGIRPAAYKGEEVGFYSNTYLSAKGRAAGSGGSGGGASALYQLLDVIPNVSGTGVEGVADGYVLAYDALAGKWKAAQRLDETALKAYLTTNKYATHDWVSGQGYLTQHQSLANYVTLNTAQEITGDKTFFSSNGNLRTVINGRDIITIHNGNYVGGWTRGLIFRKADGATNYGTFGAYGSDQALNYLYIGQNYTNPWITFNDTLVKSNITFEASSIRKTGGTSTQFLKADGSIDSNSYLTTVSASSTYVRKVGDIMTGALTVPNLVISSTEGVKHIAFSRDSYNYITTPANALLAFVMNNKVTDPNNADFIITNNGIYSGGTGVVTNGTNAHRWSNVYSVLGNFSGVITAGSSINAAGTINSGGNVNAENYIVTKKGWFQNDSVGGGLYNKGGDARWFYDGFQWYADKAVLSISTITGTRLVSNIANGTAPLVVSSSTMVNNLNSQYLGGYDRGRYVYHNAYSNTNGCLVRLTARATEACMITVHIIGNSYNSKNVPIDTTIQFYNYPPENKIVNPSAVHNGYNFGSIDVFNYDGQVYLWFKQTGLYQSFSIIARYTNGNGNYYGVNVVESITNAAKPTAEVTRSVTITPSVSALLTDNVASATKLANSRRIFGQLFDGTTDVSGEASGVTRVSNTSGSNLFLGNSDNTGFVQTSNMCASTGTAFWSLKTTGVGHFRRINLGDVENDDSSYRLAIAGSIYMNGSIISPFFRINYDNTNPYYSLTKGNVTAHFQISGEKAYVGFGINGAINITQEGKVGIGLGATTPSYRLHVNGDSYFNGSLIISANNGKKYRISVNEDYNGLVISREDGTAANLVSTGGMSAKGYASGSGGSGGGLIQNVYGYDDLGKSYSSTDYTNTFNADTTNRLAARIASLEGGSALNFVTAGTGEFLKSVSKSGTTVTFTKGTPNYINSSTTERGVKPNATGNGLLKLYFLNGTQSGIGTGTYYDALYLNSYVDNSGGGSNLITFNKSNGEMALHYQAFGAATWGTRRIVLDSGNFSNYAPTKTGGGASGSWGINITGNAATATSATTANSANALTVTKNFDPANLAVDTLKVKAYDSYTIANTPSTYGNVLEINGISGHWKPQLWFDGSSTGSVRHRNRNYNATSWGAWYTLLDTNNYAVTLDPIYLKKAGGIMTGALSVPTLTITSQNQEGHIKFSRASVNYITCPASGYMAFVSNGKAVSAANSDVIISGDRIYPGTHN
ncbi:shufflon system plasmid conjugative transfer pilus tip adhesin PilV, partial [Bacteroides nordii]|nr:shufflon system plasmid conjugative transfer pilus tip adhesin PilV [Bacteroides nordii]